MKSPEKEEKNVVQIAQNLVEQTEEYSVNLRERMKNLRESLRKVYPADSPSDAVVPIDIAVVPDVHPIHNRFVPMFLLKDLDRTSAQVTMTHRLQKPVGRNSVESIEIILNDTNSTRVIAVTETAGGHIVVRPTLREDDKGSLHMYKEPLTIREETAEDYLAHLSLADDVLSFVVQLERGELKRLQKQYFPSLREPGSKDRKK